jgi:hypothetical protein
MSDAADTPSYATHGAAVTDVCIVDELDRYMPLICAGITARIDVLVAKCLHQQRELDLRAYGSDKAAHQKAIGRAVPTARRARAEALARLVDTG